MNVKYLALPLAIFGLGSAQAMEKTVNLPFGHEEIFTKYSKYIMFDYDLNQNGAKKVVCDLENVYKGYFVFTNDKGQIRESGVYGDADGVDRITFATTGSAVDSPYAAAERGTIFVKAVKSPKAPNAMASCHYE